MGKIRGLKRKFGNSLRDYKAYLTHYNGYIELYVPQVTYKENTIHGYSASKFLVNNTIKNIPSGANYIYVFDENNALNNHLIITNEKEELNLGLIKDQNGTKPEYIKNLEKNYNLKFERHLATWEMKEIEYLHLEDEDKEDILYIEKEDDKVIAVTNILWTCSGVNDI